MSADRKRVYLDLFGNRFTVQEGEAEDGTIFASITLPFRPGTTEPDGVTFPVYRLASADE